VVQKEREEIVKICEECGARCCKGPSPNITIFDIVRILKYLNKKPRDVVQYFEYYTHEEYITKILPRNYNVAISYETVRELERKFGKYFKYMLIIKLRKIDSDCIFLKNNRCTIYPVRPMACRAYPLKISGIDDSCLLVKYGIDLSFERRWLLEYIKEINIHYNIFMNYEVFNLEKLIEILERFWNEVSIL